MGRPLRGGYGIREGLRKELFCLLHAPFGGSDIACSLLSPGLGPPDGWTGQVRES